MEPKKIFLSYRRDDSSGFTELLRSRLARHYGEEAIFRDVRDIQPSEHFREVIGAALAASGVVCVVMSKQWNTITDAAGVRRLEKPDDVVCWEIDSALRLGVPVLPVLFGGAAMPAATDLPETIQRLADITAHTVSDQSMEADFEELVRLIDRHGAFAPPLVVDVNPYSMRSAIRQDAFFHDREAERRTLRDYLRARQNCHLVGPRRIGKSSILLYAQRHGHEWSPKARVAYLDLQDPRCYTLLGWLKEVADGFGLPQPPQNLRDLMEAVEDLLAAGVHPVLCLDEFGEIAQRKEEFPKEVFMTLRSCGQRGMSILTAAPKRLSELTDPKDATSPFFNTFPVLAVRPFSETAARAYVDAVRPGVPEFGAQEKERILEFAQGQPLALQTACYHVLSTRESGESLRAALASAQAECGNLFG